ncbi:MAG: type II toxin-antitoxin system Phd/YefM family antitoxin [Candidatus Omnitrophica bacterium]|nr:type II toxin-antitoxin system Phd/YefM family antitoxin [Candidatus Omnitrophota bacterium]
MMKFVGISELKNGASNVVRQVQRGGPVVVMRHGKPCAALIRISEEEIDQLLFEDSPLVKQAVKEALNDIRAGRVVTWREFLEHERRAKAA